MKKFLLILLVFGVLFTITGCGKAKIEDGSKKEVDRKEKLKKDLEVRCEQAELVAYNLYKQNHTNEIIDGVCSRYDQKEYIVYFKAGENLVYKYKYSVDDDKIISPDNDNYNTEKLDEYAEKCEDFNANGATKATCTNHKYMLSEYKEYVNGVTERPTVFRKINLSKLK